MLNKLMIAGIIFVILIILIIVLIVVSKNKNKNKANNEPEASIFGVPNTSELKDFSYGYEKEETIVMNPITENNIENEEEKNNKEESEDNE